jgi:hypothetical protein
MRTELEIEDGFICVNVTEEGLIIDVIVENDFDGSYVQATFCQTAEELADTIRNLDPMYEGDVYG